MEPTVRRYDRIKPHERLGSGIRSTRNPRYRIPIPLERRINPIPRREHMRKRSAAAQIRWMGQSRQTGMGSFEIQNRDEDLLSMELGLLLHSTDVDGKVQDILRSHRTRAQGVTTGKTRRYPNTYTA